MKNKEVHEENLHCGEVEQAAINRIMNREARHKALAGEYISPKQQKAKVGNDKKDNPPLPWLPHGALALHRRDITREIWHRYGCQKSLPMLSA